MSEITQGTMITLEAIAERWQISEEEAAETIRAIPSMSDPDGRDSVENWLSDGTPLWTASEVEFAEDAFPELESGEAAQIRAMWAGIEGAFDAFGVMPGDVFNDLMVTRASWRSPASVWPNRDCQGVTVRQARRSLGMTPSMAAKLLGMRQDRYIKMEKHPENMSLDRWLQVAKVLGVAPDDLDLGGGKLRPTSAASAPILGVADCTR